MIICVTHYLQDAVAMKLIVCLFMKENFTNTYLNAMKVSTNYISVISLMDLERLKLSMQTPCQ